MKGERHKTEEIIRILRLADGGKNGRVEMADAKRYRELENENSELKKMLAEEMLKARVLGEALKKSINSLCEAAGS